MRTAVIVYDPAPGGRAPKRASRRPGKRTVIAAAVASLLAWPAVRAARAYWNPPPPELDAPIPPTRADHERHPHFDLAPGPLASRIEPREPMEMPHHRMRNRMLPHELTGFGNFGTRPRHRPEA